MSPVVLSSSAVLPPGAQAMEAMEAMEAKAKSPSASDRGA